MFSFSLQTISVWAFSHALEATSALQAQSHRAPPSPSHQTLKILSFRSRLRLRQSRLRLCRSMNPRTDLQPRAFDPRTFDFAGDPEPSRHEPIFDLEPRTHEPISLYVILIFCVILIDSRTHEPLISDFCCCCCGGVGGGVLVVFLLCGGGFCVGGGGK